MFVHSGKALFMKKNLFPLLLSCFALMVGRGAIAADPHRLVVKVDEPGAKFDPIFYGLMTEEINHCYDGGLYPELIQNRIFKDARRNGPRNVAPDAANPPHWSVVKTGGANGSIALDTENPV